MIFLVLFSLKLKSIYYYKAEAAGGQVLPRVSFLSNISFPFTRYLATEFPDWESILNPPSHRHFHRFLLSLLLSVCGNYSESEVTQQPSSSENPSHKKVEIDSNGEEVLFIEAETSGVIDDFATFQG